jgi:hypothetical protein
MPGSYLVTLRPRDYEANFELVVTDRSKSECTVIALTDDQVAHIAFQFAHAVQERHYYLKRLARKPVPDDCRLGDVPLQEQNGQHQQAAE